jgi:hypothetical protein
VARTLEYVVPAGVGVTGAGVAAWVGAVVGSLPPPPQAPRRVALATTVSAISAYVDDLFKGRLLRIWQLCLNFGSGTLVGPKAVNREE